MKPSIQYLFGRLVATVEALSIEGAHLSEEDEDAHKRLAKLTAKLESIVIEMGDLGTKDE